MKRFYFLVLAALLAVSCKPCCEHVRNELRAPAYPLVTIDPFTCAWSAADRLYDASPFWKLEKKLDDTILLR